MIKHILAFVFVLSCGLLPAQSLPQMDRHWFNSDGSVAQLYQQKDVYVFRTQQNGGVAQPQDPAYGIQSVEQDPDMEGLIVVRFHAFASDSMRLRSMNYFRSLPNYECEYDVLTADTTQPQSAEQWFVADQRLYVIFNDPNISQADLADFMNKWDLVLLKTPDPALPGNISWPYLFYNNAPDPCFSIRTIDLIQDIFQQDSAMVHSVEPNLLHFLVPTTNDPLYADQWYMENTGQPFSHFYTGSVVPGGVVDADCDIPEAWAKGFTGQGVRIGVIDFDGFEYSHEDMVGQYLPGYDGIRDMPLDTTANFDSLYRSHGHGVSSIIAALKDNNLGLAGVAPGAKIIPCLIGGGLQSFINCLEFLAVKNEADIINMSLKYVGASNAELASINVYLFYLVNEGRSQYGTVMVAGAGNDDWTAPNFPAARPDVISITGSTPDDGRKMGGDRFDALYPFPWGASYGIDVDFAAPSGPYPVADFTGPGGRDSTQYQSFAGTSGSSPIAAGIIALILEANGNLDTYGPISVYETLKQSAEKVGGYNYNYFGPSNPGRSSQLGFGRLNACNALNLVSLSEELSDVPASLAIAQLSNGEARAFFDASRLRGNVTIELVDLNGRPLRSIPVPNQKSWVSLDGGGLSAGLYIAGLNVNGSPIGIVKKFILVK